METVDIPLRWIEFFRRELGWDKEAGGALNIDNAHHVDAATVILGNEGSVQGLNYGEEIGYHTHPVTNTIYFPPSGADWLALLEASNRYYGELTAPNQQAAVVFAGNGTYVQYPTDVVKRFYQQLIRQIPNRSIRNKEYLFPLEQLINQALGTSDFVFIKGNDKCINNRWIRLSRDVVAIIRLCNPKQEQLIIDTIRRYLRQTQTKPVPYPAWTQIKPSNDSTFDTTDVTSLFSDREIPNLVNVLEKLLLPQHPNLQIDMKSFRLTGQLYELPQVNLMIHVCSGKTKVQGKISSNIKYEVNYPGNKLQSSYVQSAINTAFQQVTKNEKRNLFDPKLYQSIFLSKQFIQSLENQLHMNVNIEMNVQWQMEPEEISNLQFRDSRNQLLNIPKWSLNASNYPFDIIQSTIQTLGFRMTFFPPDVPVKLEVLPVPRENIKTELVGRNKRPVKIKQIAPFGRLPPKKPSVITSYQLY